MLVKGLSLSQVSSAADSVGVRLKNSSRDSRSGVRCGIIPKVKGAYQRYNAGMNRRVNGVCWHGHRDWMRALFELNPNAVIISAFARYVGRENFERAFPETYFHEAGSEMRPQYFGELCDCEE